MSSASAGTKYFIHCSCFNFISFIGVYIADLEIRKTTTRNKVHFFSNSHEFLLGVPPSALMV